MYDNLPVSSDITIDMASDSSVIPIPALCLKPKDLLIFLFFDTGKVTLDATITLPTTMTAPSCNGLFL